MATRSRLIRVLPDRLIFTLIAWQHRWYEAELGHLRDLVPPGTLAVDVGAWWGPWTYWLARRASRVVAFEPVPDLAAFLASVAPANVAVLNAALSDSTGEATIWMPAGGRGSEGVSSLEAPADGTSTTTISVSTTRLDDVELDRVGFMKIDVEGHELSVLRGAVETIRRDRPTIVAEVEQRFHQGRSVAAVFNLLSSLGYDGRFLHRGAWRPLEEFDVEEHQARMADRVSSGGYVRNLCFNARHYVNNFVFSPQDSGVGSGRCRLRI